jgi:hypothetical protein
MAFPYTIQWNKKMHRPCEFEMSFMCKHVVWAGKYRCGKENTGMESKCDSLFPSVPATWELSSSAKMLAMVWSSSMSGKLLFKLELELTLALLLLSVILCQHQQIQLILTYKTSKGEASNLNINSKFQIYRCTNFYTRWWQTWKLRIYVPQSKQHSLI